MNLSFLDASKIVSSTKASQTKEFVFVASCQLEKLDVFLKAHSLLLDINADYSTLPFNTLRQYLSNSEANKKHIVILFPWDLCPSLDWRLGVPNNELDISNIIDEANKFISIVLNLNEVQVIYCDTSIPAGSMIASSLAVFKNIIQKILIENDILALSENCFSLTSYLNNGCPICSSKLSHVSECIASLFIPIKNYKKIIITDFDNVMWDGVIGEDGVSNIAFSQQGKGYIHYIYQTYLRKIKNLGILVAGVTRNDESLAKLAFENNQMQFDWNDFVCVSASYNAKSSQIKLISKQLNLPLDSFIFIDDNPIEIEEVSVALPDVKCVIFPSKTDCFPDFIENINNLFFLDSITDDDKNRTQLYKNRSKILPPSTEIGADLTDYLISLSMKLKAKICDSGNSTRALQLINKTNQFNANGKRVDDKKISIDLNKNYTLVSFSLKDKYGDHGEIAAVLLNNRSDVINFVISCRVFQRNIEYYVLHWLFDNLKLTSLSFDYLKTDKNEPFKMYLESLFDSDILSGSYSLDLNKFCANDTNTNRIFNDL